MDKGLTELLAHIDRLESIYKQLLPSPRLWDRISQLFPGLLLPNWSSTRPGDTLSAGRHIEIARAKANSHPRIAITGPIKVGKSTFINAILHHPEIDQILKKEFECRGWLLKVGDQATTGNITEIAFTGEPLGRGRPPAEQFRFEVQYLPMNELQELLAHFDRELKLNLKPGTFQGPNWIDRLRDLLPILERSYDSPNANMGTQRKNLRVLREIIESLLQPGARDRIGSLEDLGRGKEGFLKFNKLLDRPPLEVQATWAANSDKLNVGDFHLVKYVRLHMPHPDFEGYQFSLFDFPGLGAGLCRDEHLSREFIAEANLILVLFRPGEVGGQAVEHILQTFAGRRGGMSVNKLLERIYFVHQGIPHKVPEISDPKNLVEFYKSFLQAVKNLTGAILDRQDLAPAERNRLLVEHLTHYLAFDAQLAGYLRLRDDSDQAELALGDYKNRLGRATFTCPTDPDRLRWLSEQESLRDATEGYPLLAGMLSQPPVGKAIAEVFDQLKEEAGMPHLLKRLRRFASSDALFLQCDDVREHLRAAFQPLQPLASVSNRRSVAPPIGGDAVHFSQVRPLFDEVLGSEDRWQRTIQGWMGEGRHELDPSRDAQLMSDVAELERAQASVEEAIKRKVDQLVNAEQFKAFRAGLQAETELGEWIRRDRQIMFCLSRIWKIAPFGLVLPERRFHHEQRTSSPFPPREGRRRQAAPA